MSNPILTVKDLKIHYPLNAHSLWGKPSFVKAVDGVTFDVQHNEVLGIVGESGCGKSTLGKGICRLAPITQGSIILDGVDVTNLNREQMRGMRKTVQMVFQDPYASLNPRMSIFDIVAEPLRIHGLKKPGKETEERVMELLRQVGLDRYHANRYPHEFSGGQRQRVGIARTLALNPDFIVCDEPISALDVSIQAQIINLLEKIQDEQGIS